MKYFKLEVHPPIVGTDGHFKFKADDKKGADDIAHDKAIEHIESYVDIEEQEEESGIDFEYDYNYEEITEEEYNKLEDYEDYRKYYY